MWPEGINWIRVLVRSRFLQLCLLLPCWCQFNVNIILVSRNNHVQFYELYFRWNRIAWNETRPPPNYMLYTIVSCQCHNRTQHTRICSPECVPKIQLLELCMCVYHSKFTSRIIAVKVNLMLLFVYLRDMFHRIQTEPCSSLLFVQNTQVKINFPNFFFRCTSSVAVPSFAFNKNIIKKKLAWKR